MVLDCINLVIYTCVVGIPLLVSDWHSTTHKYIKSICGVIFIFCEQLLMQKQLSMFSHIVKEVDCVFHKAK